MSVFGGLLAYPLTPADSDGHVDTDALGTFVSRLIRPGVSAIGVLGSTGTYAYLSPEERAHATRAALEAANGRVPVVIGVGALRTDIAIQLAHVAERAGASGLLLAPQSYLPLTEDELLAHYSAVAEATELPLCIYCNPGTTGVRFSDDMLARLSEVPTIAGVKLPPTDDPAAEIERLRARLPEGFAIGYSGDQTMCAALLAGADGFHSALAGTILEPLTEMAAAAIAGDREKAVALDAQLEPLWTLVRAHGSLRVAYAAASVLGLTEALPPRPILPLDPAPVADALQAAGIT